MNNTSTGSRGAGRERRRAPEGTPAVQADARLRLEELATALHASYISRWGRHDRAGLERELDHRRGRISAA